MPVAKHVLLWKLSMASFTVARFRERDVAFLQCSADSENIVVPVLRGHGRIACRLPFESDIDV